MQFTKCPVSIEICFSAFIICWHLTNAVIVYLQWIKSNCSHLSARQQIRNQTRRRIFYGFWLYQDIPWNCIVRVLRIRLIIAMSSLLAKKVSYYSDFVPPGSKQAITIHMNLWRETSRAKTISSGAEHRHTRLCVSVQCAFNRQAFMDAHNKVYYTVPQKSKKHLYYSFSKNIFTNSFFS